MMNQDDFNARMRERNPELYPNQTAAPTLTLSQNPPPTQPGQLPVGVQQIFDAAGNFMPAIENLTGLNRKDIFLAFIKGGLKGGNLDNILASLMGQPQQKPSRFEKIMRTGAIWIPVGVLLMGLAVVGVIGFFKLIMMLLGA